MTIRVGVAGIGLVAPGIETWEEGREYLVGEKRYQPSVTLPRLTAQMLPANERRRTTTHIKLALQCGQDALSAASEDPAKIATVFTSSGGDLDTMDKILTSLGQPGKPVSPTQFHNSVLNAAAGYWSIATRSHLASISISVHDGSFAGGLLEAASQVQIDQHPVLLVASDPVSPPALHPFRPLVASFAVALLLVPHAAHSAVTVEPRTLDAFSVMDDPGLEALRTGNPAARSLPLLRQLAAEESGRVDIPYLSGLGVRLEVEQC